MTSAKPLAAKPGWVVGRNLRDLRVEQDWTQEDVARQLRLVGLPWTRSHVAALEGERRDDIALAELLFLSAASASGRSGGLAAMGRSNSGSTLSPC